MCPVYVIQHAHNNWVSALAASSFKAEAENPPVFVSCCRTDGVLVFWSMSVKTSSNDGHQLAVPIHTVDVRKKNIKGLLFLLFLVIVLVIVFLLLFSCSCCSCSFF